MLVSVSYLAESINEPHAKSSASSAHSAVFRRAGSTNVPTKAYKVRSNKTS